MTWKGRLGAATCRDIWPGDEMAGQEGSSIRGDSELLGGRGRVFHTAGSWNLERISIVTHANTKEELQSG